MDDPNSGAALRHAKARGDFPAGSPSLPVEIAALATPSPFVSFGIFIGPNGLRAGWRVFLYLFGAIIFGFGLDGLLWLLGFKWISRLDPLGLICADGLSFMALFLSAAVMARIEKHSFADFALPLRGAFGWKFWQGFLWGFLALSALLLILRFSRAFDFGVIVMHGPDALYFGAAWAMAFLAVALFEEFLFRGYALYALTRGMGFWPAAVLLSLVFGVVHLGNGGENWVGAAAAVVVGLFSCLTVRRTGSLWFAIGLHAMWDYSQSFLYSVPDSGLSVRGHLSSPSFHGPAWLTGGSVGPEGSVLAFFFLAAMLIVFDRLHRKVRYPPAAGKLPNPAVDLHGGGAPAKIAEIY